MHTITVEKASAPTETAYRAVCVAGENACPPEDVGGPPGYQEFLLAIADPEHEEHEEMLNWCGGGFDATAFDLKQVNRKLERLKF